MGTVHRNHEGVSNVAAIFFENSLSRSVNVDKIPEDLDLPTISEAHSSGLSAPFSRE